MTLESILMSCPPQPVLRALLIQRFPGAPPANPGKQQGRGNADIYWLTWALKAGCPLCPQKRTLGLSRVMSALCQKLT
jgi:hypothetical protein